MCKARSVFGGWVAVVQTSRWVQALSVGGMVYSSTTVGNAQKKENTESIQSQKRICWDQQWVGRATRYNLIAYYGCWITWSKIWISVQSDQKGINELPSGQDCHSGKGNQCRRCLRGSSSLLPSKLQRYVSQRAKEEWFPNKKITISHTKWHRNNKKTTQKHFPASTSAWTSLSPASEASWSSRAVAWFKPPV